MTVGKYLSGKERSFYFRQFDDQYVNGWEVSRNNPVRARSPPVATSDDFIDYVRKKNLTW